MMLSGILMAIIGRNQTGRGTFIASSLLACGIWYNASSVLYAQEPFNYPLPPDPLRPGNPFIHFYKCKDGEWINITVFNYDRAFPRISKLFGFEKWNDDPNFSHQKLIHTTGAVEQIVQHLNAVFLTKTSAEWAEYLTKADIVYEIMGHTKAIAQDPQARANGYLCDVEFSNGVKAVMPNAPLHFSEYGSKGFSVPTCVGENTDTVLASLGYAPEEIAALRTSGSVK
jgi:crotonobetainyl-CoA:carnitine CoA-transferase CaiB-like acyl-CoA transferase